MMLKHWAVGLSLLSVALPARADQVCNNVFSEYSAIEELCPYHNGFARIKIRHGWGFVDKAGRIAIAPNFDIERVDDFSDGLAAVKIGGKWGFIDTSGTMRIAPRFESVWAFRDGLAAASEGGKEGYIDQKGEWLFPPRFADAGPFVNGVAVVADRYGESYLIDREGRAIKRFDPPVKIDSVPNFGVYKATRMAQPRLAHRDGRNLPLPANAGDARYSAGVLIARATDEDGALVGAMTLEGRWIISPRFSELDAFQDGLAIATLPEGNKGVTDTKGKWAIPARYARLERLQNGLYSARRDGSAETEIFDKTGRLLLTAACAELQDTHLGHWSVFSGCDAAWVLYQQKNVQRVALKKPAIEYTHQYLLLTEEDDASATSAAEAEPDDNNRYAKKFALLNSEGVVLASDSPGVKGEYDWAKLVTPEGPLADSAPEALPVAVLVKRYENLAIVTRRHAIVTRPEWRYELDALDFRNDDAPLDGPLTIKTEAGWGAIDADGNWVIQPRYYELSLFRNGLAFARDDQGRELLVDNAGGEHAFPDGYRFSRVEPWIIQGVDDNHQPVRYDVKRQALLTVATEPGVSLDGERRAGLIAAKKGDLWGLMDTSGRWALPPRYETAPEAAMDDKRFLGWKVTVASMRDGVAVKRVGWVTPEGHELIKPAYAAIEYDANSALFTVSVDHRYGIVTSDGKTLLPPLYRSVKVLGDGWVLAEQGELIGLLDAKGDWLIEPTYYNFHDFGRRPYSKEEVAGKTFLVHVDGRISTPDQPLPLADDKAAYWLGIAADEYGRNQKTFHGFDWKPRLTLPGTTTNEFSEDRLVFDSSSRPGYPMAFADSKGRIYGPFPYLELDDFHNARARFKQALPVGGKKGAAEESVERFGYIDPAGKPAIPARYEAADRFSDDRAVVQLKGNLGIIDQQGTLLLHSAWRCGVDPVLLDGKGQVIWPADEAGDCR